MNNSLRIVLMSLCTKIESGRAMGQTLDRA
jgi:hypothetical protein